MMSQPVVEPVQSSIFIVDDNPQNLQVLGKILLENRFKIEFSTSGEAALEWLKKKKFDLILLDINMPGMDGYEVCRRIRANPDMNNLPVIFLSADAERESILKGFELGAQDYVTKPFDSRELLVRVKTHLKLKESLETLERFNKTLEEKVAERTLLLKETNEKLERTNFKLLGLDKAKTAFLNLISHEISTPLNGIAGPLLLLRETVHTNEIDELVDILDISVKRLERFALDALLITKLQTKPGEMKKQKIDLNNLVTEVLVQEKEKILSKDIHIVLENDAAPALINGEGSLLKKCLGNVIDNALRFSPVSGKIGIRIFAEGQNYICEFSDSGKGFDKPEFDNVFELFTTDSVYTDNCIGIGLPVARMIMEEHEGNISIANRSSGGAIVKLMFKGLTGA
jgi:two-component system sensor histidine kinase/response regulator